MALTTKTERGSKKFFWVAIIIIFIGLSGYLLYSNYIAKPKLELSNNGTGLPSANTNQKSTSTYSKDLPIYQDLGEEVLESEMFKSLKLYGTIPVPEGRKGVTNPFLPSF